MVFRPTTAPQLQRILADPVRSVRVTLMGMRRAIGRPPFVLPREPEVGKRITPRYRERFLLGFVASCFGLSSVGSYQVANLVGPPRIRTRKTNEPSPSGTASRTDHKRVTLGIGIAHDRRTTPGGCGSERSSLPGRPLVAFLRSSVPPAPDTGVKRVGGRLKPVPLQGSGPLGSFG